MIRQLHYLGLLLPLFTTSSWAAEQNSSVHIAPAGSHTAVYGSAENFIGRVRVDPLFNADNDIRVSAAYVTFEPGARSAWHTHPAGQRLIVTSGVGLTQQEGKPVQVIRAGDVVSCPADVKHWHGAAPGSAMTHLAITGMVDGKSVNWKDIHTDWRGYAILPFATEYRENRVALNANSLADNVELDETVVTVIPTHGAIARATFNVQIGGKVLMTLKYGNKSVPFGAIVTHGENKNGSIVAENGQVYLTGLPQSGKLQVSWGKDKNSNCIVEYKLPEVSPGTLLNQQTAICR